MGKDEEILSAYAQSMESEEQEAPRARGKRQPADVPPAAETVAPRPSGRPESLARTKDVPVDRSGNLVYRDNLGYAKIPVDTLPTGGLFYPEGTEILIRAARGEEIKHWSTMNDQDLNALSAVDDILNYIIEKCVAFKVPGKPTANWKDLKDIDRMYLLMAVREYTFPDGNNELKVPLSEGKDMTVRKEMIDFIKIPDEIAKFYSSEERCFVLNLKNGRTFRMHIPSLGASIWLKNYAQAKANAREQFDQDFIMFAPLLISDFRRLSQRAYEEMVSESHGWNVTEWSVLSKVRDMLTASAEPKFKYTDDNGQEVQIPLTFRGGIKAIFTLSDPLSALC